MRPRGKVGPVSSFVLMTGRVRSVAIDATSAFDDGPDVFRTPRRHRPR